MGGVPFAEDVFAAFLFYAVHASRVFHQNYRTHRTMPACFPQRSVNVFVLSWPHFTPAATSASRSGTSTRCAHCGGWLAERTRQRTTRERLTAWPLRSDNS